MRWGSRVFKSDTRHVRSTCCDMSANADRMCSSLMLNMKVAEVCLKMNMVNNAVVETLAYVISRYEQLRRLELACPMQAKILLPLVIHSLPHCGQLRVLDLSECVPDTYHMNQIIRPLAEALPRCLQLRELYLISCCICIGLVEPLAIALPQCPRLRVLDLSNNPLKSGGMTALAASLPQCHRLRSLVLWGVDMCHSGASALANVLPRCLQLRSVNLGFHRLGLAATLLLHQSAPRTLGIFICDSPHGCHDHAYAVRRQRNTQNVRSLFILATPRRLFAELVMIIYNEYLDYTLLQ
jgi:hypothetical protein